MGRRTWLLAAAFVVAAVGTTLVFLYVNGVNDRAIADQQPQKVLVATSEIPAGMSGADAESAAKFAIRTLSKDSVAPDALGDATSIQNQVALGTIFPGEQILSTKFGASASTSRLVVPPGKLALSVQAGPQQSLGQFLAPGSHVVVFLTRPNQGTAVLLPDVEIIATGNQTLDGSGEADASGLLTLAVDQTQAQKVILGTKVGELYFALRTKGVTVNATDPGITENQIGQ